MRPTSVRTLALLIATCLGAALSAAGPAAACGGFFCQNSPVDQVAERILFTVNDNETITSLIEISYQGEADDFSWILPIPEAIAANDLQVPDDGETVFDELHALTDVQFIAPRETRCVGEFRSVSAMSDDATAEAGGVEIFASGEVGPFGFDVIGSDDPDALVSWLRDNNYRVDESMEPLIDVYVDEQFAFIAMRLLDGESSESITPIEITYPGTQPMIPIRLTAVAAQPQMPIYAWILADEQAVPENYEHFEIATEELTFTPFGFPDYSFLVQSRADAVGGQGFITEFAGPANSLRITNPYLSAQAEAQPYLTRLATYLDPAEMTVDPVFGFDGSLEDVSNVRDASKLVGLYDCERQATLEGDADFGESDALDSRVINAALAAGTFVGFEELPDDASVESNAGTIDENGSPVEVETGTVETAAGDAADSDRNLLPFIAIALVAAAAAAVALTAAYRLGNTRR